MSKFSQVLINQMEQGISNKQQFLASTDQIEQFDLVAQAIIESYKKGGRLYIAGNGGSAADAQHLAAEFVCRLCNDRPSIAAEALTVDSSILTSVGNDYHYDEIFSRQLESKLSVDDVFLGITTSGNSPNILKSLEVCQKVGATSVLLSGRDGGKAKVLSNFSILVPGKTTGAMQELHIAIEHALCSCIESDLYPEQCGLSI
ncbi:MAG: SIS domain-containing protein [Methylococcales bacterium]|nr:SIS domain-containing protein [Methylococcales bacterium]MBT7408638.1 SIS domain-containing protein [Methylococcales bacterium]